MIKLKWHEYYFAEWMPINMGELVIVLLAITIAGITFLVP